MKIRLPSSMFDVQGPRFNVGPHSAPAAQKQVRGEFRALHSAFRTGFTLVEILIAIGILSMIIASIFSCWTAILRGKRVGLDAAAAVQRSRIVIRTLEDSLASAQCFVLNAQYYGFVAENGQEASLSFVARLAKSFPRGGRFGDFDVRRLTFSVEPGSEGDRQLVLRQNSVFMEMDIDEKEHPLVLAKNVKAFQLDFWDAKASDWTDEWTQTNQIPKLVRVTLRLADNAQSTKSQEVTRIISLPAIAVQPGWQMPMGGPAPRQGLNPPGGQGQGGLPSGSQGGKFGTP
jgi:prepilin-type N-terminal cleavage/methylation domain-containing protein